MGKPKFSRKKYETPSHPWQEDRIKSENELIKKYGLKNKREIWKAQTALRKYRGQARELLAKIGSDNPQVKKESEQLLSRLTRMNILPLNSNLDDVLALDIEPILSRRLETLTYLKGLSNTPKQARQLISHGHISIGGRKITVPGYMVTKDEEPSIEYTINSPLNDTMHPARPSSEFKSPITPIEPRTKEEKSEGVKEEKTKEKDETVKEKKEISDKTKTEKSKPEKLKNQDKKPIESDLEKQKDKDEKVKEKEEIIDKTKTEKSKPVTEKKTDKPVKEIDKKSEKIKTQENKTEDKKKGDK
jgi:small subunit ribosomal protein S4